MANREHLTQISQGSDAWHSWRATNPEIIPDLRGENLSGIVLRGADLSEARLARCNLVGADLSGSNLYSADLREADLQDANLDGANLEWASLRAARLDRARVERAILKDAIAVHASLVGARCSETTLLMANFYSADLTEANFYRADLTGANFYKAILNGTNLREANLRNARLVATKLNNADLTSAHVHGISAWNLELAGTKQSDLTISLSGEPNVTVDSLEVAQFVYLLLNHAKLHEVFNSITERAVLILGRFGGGGLEILRDIADRLRSHDPPYLPMVFDFERPRERNYTETIHTLTRLSRFVIADLSGPSVPHELASTVPYYKIPFVLILEQGRNTYSMLADIMEYPWVLRPPVEFRNREELLELLPSRVIAPAEEKFRERQKLLRQLFAG